VVFFYADLFTFIPLHPISNKIIAFLFSTLLFCPSFSQNRTIDSLKKLPPSFKNDTLLCYEYNNILGRIETLEEFIPYNNLIIQICKNGLKRPDTKIEEWNYYVELWCKRVANVGYVQANAGKLKEAIHEYTSLLEIEKKFKEVDPPAKRTLKEMTGTLNLLAYLQYQNGNPTMSMNYFNQSLDAIQAYRTVNASYADLEKASIYNNLGFVLQNLGDIPHSLEAHDKSLALRFRLNKEHHSTQTEIDLAQSYNNLGKLYDELGDAEKGMEYYQKSLAILQKNEDQMGISVIYNNIGGIYSGKKEYRTAIDYYEKSIEMKKKIGDEAGLSQSYSNIASICRKMGDLEKAMRLYPDAIAHGKKAVSPEQLGYAYCDQGETYKQMGKLDEAKNVGEKAYEIAKSIGLPLLLVHASNLLYSVYTLKSEFQKAIEMGDLNMKMHDSIMSGDNRKALIQQEYKHAYEKKQLADSVRTYEENKIFRAQIKADKMQKNGLLAGISVLILFSFFMYSRFRVIKVQKKIIEKQSSLVHEQKLIAEIKQQEVLSSIRYAKKIQTALLPNEKQLNSLLNKNRNAI
jgi:tetratricopeptide (TPR) repeat protein